MDPALAAVLASSGTAIPLLGGWARTARKAALYAQGLVDRIQGDTIAAAPVVPSGRVVELFTPEAVPMERLVPPRNPGPILPKPAGRRPLWEYLQADTDGLDELLDDGWAPFAVTVHPLIRSHQVTVYVDTIHLRRPRATGEGN